MQETGPPAYFGEWLKLRRKALDLTQAELAGRANCSLPGLRKIEGGERRPSALLAKLLGQALEVSAEELDTFVKVARGELNLERLRAPGSLRPAVPAPYQESPRSRLNLPVEPTPFIGRETELATLDRLLADPQCRLLTVMGMGGMGKTRLVIELASRRQDHFPGGAYFVSLASLSSPDYIIPAIAEAAGLTFSGSSQPRQQLFNYLEFHTRRAMLLVLDNLEHLLALPGQAAAGEDAAALMAEMLHRAPALKLLVTSRERVNIQGEWVFELQGLPYPADEESFNLEAYSAPALFVQRARQVKIDFEVLPDERPALLSVCELTEGTPLAIELAAAWVGVLSLDEIAREIAANLEFLASSMRDMPERHRSMRVVFDQSWKMLSTGEQQALSQLSVFQGGFSRQAAEQVAGATLPVLSALADWSLLRRTGPGRYDMHELVRQYGALRLAANPRELEKTRQRHFDFFLALAETAARELKGGGQREWLDRLEQDHDNLRAAQAWALDYAGKLEGTDELPLRLAGALRWFWRMRGHFHEGRHSLVMALQRCPSKPTAARAGALLGLSLLTNALGELVAALQPAEESAAIFQELGDSPGLAEALLIAGLTQVWQGEAEAGSARMEKALALYRTAGNPWDVAYALYRLGAAISDFQGNMEGRRMLEESAGILKSLGESYIYISVLISIAILDNGIGDYELATQRLEKALAVGREIDHPWGVADALCNLGSVKRIQGRYPDAQAHLEAAQRIYQEHGSSTWEIDVLCALSEIDISQGSLSAARQRLQTAAGRLESSGHRWLEALVRYFQGLLLYFEGEPAESAGLLEAVIEIAEHGEYRPDLARALVSLGRARLAMGQAPAAVESFVQGMQQFNQLGHRLGVATALEGLAAAHAAQEDYPQAVALSSAAHSLRTALGAPLPPVDQPAWEAMLAACRTRLGEEEFAEAWKRGAAMSVEHIETGLLS